MCPTCEANGIIEDAEAMARNRPIVAFHSELLRAATSLAANGELPSPHALLERGRALGISHFDLLMGVLQPVLYELGRLWQAGTLAPATEAHFSAFAERVLDEVVAEQHHRLGRANGRPVFLVAAAGNRHTIGIRMLGFKLRESGHDVRVVTNPIEVGWLARLAAILQPTVIGISIALPDQLRYAVEVLALIDGRGIATRVVVGGFGLAAVDDAAIPARLGRMTRTFPMADFPFPQPE